MASDYESFWQMKSYAVVGHSARRRFPRLTYGGLKDNGKQVYAVDPTAEQIEGDRAYADLKSVPAQVDAVVVEVPPEETAEWVRRAADVGVKDVWLHMGTDSPDALAIAREHDIRLRKGTCAVMYLKRGISFHALHGFINKLVGKY